MIMWIARDKEIIEKFKQLHPEACEVKVGHRFDGPEVEAWDNNGAYMGCFWYNGDTFEKEKDYSYARVDINLKNGVPPFGVYYIEKNPYGRVNEGKIVEIVREKFMEEIKKQIMESITEENIILHVGDLDGWPAPYSQIKDKLIEI